MKKNKFGQNELIKKLNKYFIFSTFFPFMFFVTFCSFLFNSYYVNDIMAVTDGYIDSLALNTSFYFNDLEYATLLPYFNNEILNEIKNHSNKDNISFIEKTDLETKLDNLLSSTRYIKNDFYSAILVNDKTLLYSSSYNNKYSINENFEWNNEAWFKEAIEKNGKTVFVPPHYPDYYSENNFNKVFSVVRSIRNIRTQTPYAVIKIDALSTTLDSIFEKVNFHVPNVIFIADDDMNLFFSNGSIYDSDLVSERKVDTNNEKLTINDKLAYSIKKLIPNTNLTLYILLDKKFILLKSARIFIIGLLLYGLAFLIASLFNINFNKRISDPELEIKNVLKEVQKGNLKVHFKAQEKWELQQIGSSINNMIEELDKTIQIKYIAELKYKEAEMKVLMEQIQPHFLFNTITSLISLIYKNDLTSLEKNLYALCDLLRFVLKKDQYVGLKEEFLFLEDYLLLQKNRFNDKFSYSVSFDESVSNFRIPKLLIQPFIENAVIHGIEPNLENSHLNFFIKRKSDEILIVIEDDGVGFDSKKQEYDKSIGIINSMERLKIMYPKSYIEIVSELNKGCLVLIHIISENEKER